MKLSTYLSLLNRRRWLKIVLLGAVGETVFGKANSFGVTEAAKGTAPQADAPSRPMAAHLTPTFASSCIIPIRVSDYPSLALGAGGGSISLYFSNLLYPMVINRDATGEFYALDPTCTHAGCQVNNLDPSNSLMQCDCHGSQFSAAGQVVTGPAFFDLSVYPSHFDGDDLLEVELIGVPLRIDRVSLQSRSAGSTRLKIEFPGTSGCKYQVKYHANLTSPAQTALVSLTAAGPANQTSVTIPQYSPSDPLSGDGPKNIWVDAPGTSGFFTIELELGDFGPP